MTHTSEGSAQGKEMIITRVINAPRELVWRAWTEPTHLEQWWGPDGFSVTSKTIDVRVGGTWDFIMHGPDGVDYPNLIVFKEFNEPESISYSHGENEGDADSFQSVVTFEEQDGGTLVTLKVIFSTVEALKHTVDTIGAIEGGKQTLGRLADYAQQMA